MVFKKRVLKAEAGKCLLCHEAPCDKACPQKVEISRIIRAVRFKNESGAAKRIPDLTICDGCEGYCMEVCNRSKIDRPVDIKSMFYVLPSFSAEPSSGVDLSIESLGVKFENPFLLSSSVVGSNYEMVAKAFEMGWAGVAFKTVGFFIPNEVSPRFSSMGKEDTPFIGFKNIEQTSDHTVEENMDFIRRLKKDYPSKVVIASIMGQNASEWTELAKLMEEAGADIIECNFSCPQMVGEGLGSDVGTNPGLVAEYVKATRAGTSLPILAKMTPNITSMEEPAAAALAAGADGLAAINTIKSIMNIDLYGFGSSPNVEGKSSVGGYSGKAVKPIALRFINDLKKDPRTKDAPISGMGGIETWKDAAEFIFLGCETVQITTAVMEYGYRIIDDLIEGLQDYMETTGLRSVSELVGRAVSNIIDPGELDRDTIELPRFDKTRCVGCGRCYVSCYDGGHQAIIMDKETGQPKLNTHKCVGCHLCRLICPSDAIHRSGARIPKEKMIHEA